jgi:hypothetical protein
VSERSERTSVTVRRSRVTVRVVKRPALLLVIASAVLLAGCGIEDDGAPRDIPVGDRPALVNAATQTAEPESGTDRIYLLTPESPDQAQLLRPSPRNVGQSATLRLNSLFGALTVVELSARLHTAIPEGLTLHSAVLQSNGTLIVDVSDQLLDLSSSALIDAVAQIVFTAAEVRNVQRIDLRVDGKTRQWPTGNGALSSEPLTVYDYPGLVESSQPDFPAIPSPEPDR